jgi:hypothetical protein
MAFLSGSVRIGNYSTELAPGPLTGFVVADLASLDTYALLGAYATHAVDGIGPGVFSFELRDPSGTALDDWLLPTIPPDLADFAGFPGRPNPGYFSMAIDDSYGRFFAVEFSLTGLHAPEPASGSLLALGLIALGMRRKARAT